MLSTLIAAAQQYLTNAGVAVVEATEPVEGGEGEGEESPPPDPAYSLYQLAVCLYVNKLWDPDIGQTLDPALTAIILQIKDYGGESD